MIIIIAILAAIAIPMYLSQRNKAKDAAVQGGHPQHQIGIQSYAIDNNDTYPAATHVVQTGTVAPYVDSWPRTPTATTPRRTWGGHHAGPSPTPWESTSLQPLGAPLNGQHLHRALI